jgi:hypothetical protein
MLEMTVFVLVALTKVGPLLSVAVIFVLSIQGEIIHLRKHIKLGKGNTSKRSVVSESGHGNSPCLTKFTMDHT